MEAVDVIDDILEEGADCLEYVRGLWEKLTIRYKLWPTFEKEEAEYQTAVSSVFYAVAVVLSTHEDDFFKDTVKDAVLAEIDSHTSIVKQEEDRVLASLSKYAEGLEQWLEDYATSDTYLSKEIDDVAHDRKPKTTMAMVRSKITGVSKPESRKVDKKVSVHNKKTWKDEVITHSFNYSPKGMSTEERNNRLSTFFNLLNRRYVSHTNMSTFIDIFSGVTTNEYIVWIRYIVELQYLIEKLIERGLITWTRPAPGKWQIVSARFRYEHNVKEGEEGHENSVRIIDSLDAKQFNKIPKKSKLSEHPLLDKIISILIPETNAQRISNEVLEIFAHAEISEDESKTQPQVKPIDY